MTLESWALAIMGETLTWGFVGIRASTAHGNRRQTKKLHEVLLADESYCNKLVEDEVSCYMSSDWIDEWQEHCAGDLDKFKDVNKRYEWAYGYVEFEHISDMVKMWCDDVDWVKDFLKAHPIESVEGNGWDRSKYDFDEVRGFCRECGEPQVAEDVTTLMSLEEVDSADKPPPHPYAADCQEIGCVEANVGCLYNHDGSALRLGYRCSYCGDVDPLVLYGNEDPGNRHPPFNWPPGAPWPPRRGFLGEPMEMPPWEE